MSRFFSDRYSSLIPYVPGEQPRNRKYLKLNTNESPFPPSENVIRAVSEAASSLQLYSDPESTDLRAEMSRVFGVSPDNIIMTNGSDEALNFAFMAFSDESRPLRFPDITYGFYPVYAELNHIPYEEIPLCDDFTIDLRSYEGKNSTVVIANPNAPTGIALSLGEIECFVSSNPEIFVIVDEAYVDFGAESCVSLTEKYENLLVIGTFSKSRSLAGGRLGFAIGQKSLIADMNTLRNSTNPYNVNRITGAAGIAVLRENEVYIENCRKIEEAREWTRDELGKLGFTVLPSKTNFLFARSDVIGGEELYLKLKERGILIRHFTKPRIADFNRITVGTKAQMETFIEAVTAILKEAAK